MVFFTGVVVGKESPQTAMASLAAWEERRVGGARERMLREAFQLFYENGVRAVGVDLIIAQSGVAKATFYRHFPSKVDLILAYLERRHTTWLRWLTADVAARADDARGRLLAIFDSLGDLFADPGFRGSATINAAIELGGTTPEVVETVGAARAATRRYISGLAGDAGLREPIAVAEQWELLMYGAVVAAQCETETAADPARQARRMAELLLLAAEGSESGLQRRSRSRQQTPRMSR